MDIRKEIQMTLLELPITEKVFALSIMMDEVIAACRQTQKELPRVIKNISIEDIDPFPDHPYYVEDDANMKDLICSIKKHGVLSPGIVRTKVDGRYEMLSGHRRLYACRL